jgi:hypothetical protein
MEEEPEEEPGDTDGVETVEQEVKWLFSEMEGHWCEGFFRAAPDRGPAMFLAAATRRARAVRMDDE